MTNSAEPNQLASSEANWSGSTLFAKTAHVVLRKKRLIFRREVNNFTSSESVSIPIIYWFRNIIFVDSRVIHTERNPVIYIAENIEIMIENTIISLSFSDEKHLLSLMSIKSDGILVDIKLAIVHQGKTISLILILPVYSIRTIFGDIIPKMKFFYPYGMG